MITPLKTSKAPSKDIELVGVFRFTRTAAKQHKQTVVELPRSVSSVKRQRSTNYDDHSGFPAFFSDTTSDRAEFEFGSSLCKRRLTSENRVVGMTPLQATYQPERLALKRRHQSRVQYFTQFRDTATFTQQQKMKDLHVECDYSSDEDNIRKDCYKLIHDLTLAVQFYVCEEPLDLVRRLER